MAKRAPVSIVFGDDTFEIRPLTVDQVERIEGVLSAMNGQPSVKEAREIVGIGLSRDHEDVDLGSVEATVADLSTAMGAVLSQGGFLDPPGEAMAAAENATTGGKSVGGSRPHSTKRPRK